MRRRDANAHLLAALALAAATCGIAQAPLVIPSYDPADLPVLAEGEPIEGALDEQDGQNFKDGSRLDLVALPGAAGDPVVIEATSETVDTHLTLYGPEGTLVAVNDDGPEGLDARIGVDLPADGTYVVVVSGFDRDDLGPYRLVRRRPAAAEAEPIEVPGELHTTLDVDMLPEAGVGEGPSRAFRVVLDEPLLLMVTAHSSDVDTVLAAFAEDGERVARNDDSDLGTDSRLWLDLEPGRYRIVIASFERWGSGNVRLRTRAYRPVD